MRKKTLRIQKTILETNNFTNIVDADIKFIYDYIERYKAQLTDHKAISPEYEVEYRKLTKNLNRAETQLLVWDENLQKFDTYEIKIFFFNLILILNEQIRFFSEQMFSSNN